jgi:hypothetical protein
MTEAGFRYIYLPGLKVGTETMDALLCPQPKDGYLTRLFLERPVRGKGNNWSSHRILDRTWHTWSWNHVSADQRPAQILVEHLQGLR